MSQQKSGNKQVKSVDGSDANQNQSDELLFQNFEQIRKNAEMKKELEFWKQKCIDLRMNLDMQKVQANENNREKDDMNTDQKRKQVHLEQQVSKLQKDLENTQNQNKSLKMQLADKEKQIQTLDKKTGQHFDELHALQEKIKQLKEENYEQQEDKKKLEAQLAEVKKENTDLKNKSSEHSTNQMTPEQCLEVLGDLDLTEMARFHQMVQAKYMLMYSTQLLDMTTNKGGAPPNAMQMPFPNNGLMNNFNSQFMQGMVPNMQMGGAPGAGGMPQMGNQPFTNLQQYPNAAMGLNNNGNQGNFMVPNGFSQEFNNRP